MPAPAAEVRRHHLALCRAEVQSNLPAVASEGDAMRTELLCNVRGLLKKIKQSVLVGDRVRVAGIDWEDYRGDLPLTWEMTTLLDLCPETHACVAAPKG